MSFQFWIAMFLQNRLFLFNNSIEEISWGPCCTLTRGVPGWHFVLSHWLLFHKLSKEMRYADSNAFDTVLKWWPAEPFKSNWILHPSHFTIGAQGRSKLSGFPESSRAAEIFWFRISPFTDIQSLGMLKIHSFVSRAGWKILDDFGEKVTSLKFAFFPNVN